MARLIKAEGIGEAYGNLLNMLLTGGHDVSPRGMKTKEILNVTLEITQGINNVLICPKRGVNYRFMVAEWLWIQAGINLVDLLTPYNKIMKEFSDDGQTLSGAYGPRLETQWDYIVASLSKGESRQAVSIIWSQNPEKSKDIPCTISLQWFIRDSLLHCTVNMRSSDAWLGLPYDFFTFSQLTNVLASRMSVNMGSITMNLASSHIYEKHWADAVSVIIDDCDSITSPTIPTTASLLRKEVAREVLLKRQDPSQLSMPFNFYATSLLHSKEHCLEILRELSTY